MQVKTHRVRACLVQIASFPKRKEGKGTEPSTQVLVEEEEEEEKLSGLAAKRSEAERKWEGAKGPKSWIGTPSSTKLIRGKIHNSTNLEDGIYLCTRGI